jgi:hypothetical protein
MGDISVTFGWQAGVVLLYSRRGTDKSQGNAMGIARYLREECHGCVAGGTMAA